MVAIRSCRPFQPMSITLERFTPQGPALLHRLTR
jgi:hypothetical protein